MKKILLAASAVCILFITGCTVQSEAVNYRFKDDPKIHTFALKTTGVLVPTTVLLVDGAIQDTIPFVNAFASHSSSLSQWNGKTVEITSIFHYRIIYSWTEVRLFIDNEKIFIWD